MQSKKAQYNKTNWFLVVPWVTQEKKVSDVSEVDRVDCSKPSISIAYAHIFTP